MCDPSTRFTIPYRFSLFLAACMLCFLGANTTGWAQPSNLLLAEIADPQDVTQGRFVEIYHAGTTTIDFSVDTVYLACQNGNDSTEWWTYQLSGTLPPKGVLTIAFHPTTASTGFQATYSLQADNSTNNTQAASGDGNDTYALLYGGVYGVGTVLDVFGVINENGTGQSWEYTDQRAYRKTNLTTGNSTWTSSEWIISGSTANAADCTPKRRENERRYHSSDGAWAGGSPGTGTGSVNATVQSGTLVLSSAVTVDSLFLLEGTSVTLSSNTALTINGQLYNDDTLGLSEDAQLLQATGSTLGGSGTYEVNRTFKNDASQWHIFSPPLSDIDIIDFLPSDNLYDVFSFEGATQDWRYDFDLGGGTPTNGHANSPYSGFSSGNMLGGADGLFDPARGYFIPGTDGGSGERSYFGTVNNGNLSESISTSDVTGLAWTGNDWNLLGNPYPCDLDAIAFFQANLSKFDTASGIYFWDDISSNSSYHEYDDYASWNLAGGVPSANSATVLEDYIASFQGFWVAALDEGAEGGETYSISFTNAMRNDTTTRPFYKRSDRQRAWIRASNDSGYANNILVAFIPETTSGIDAGYDARKLLGNPNFYFASLIDTLPMVIQSVAPLESEERYRFELLLGTGFEGIHVFDLWRTELLPATEYNIYLVDELEVKEHDLREGPYTVYLDSAGEYRDRFYLDVVRGTAPPDTSDTLVHRPELSEDLEMRLYANSEGFHTDASLTAETIESMSVRDLTGRTVATSRCNSVRCQVPAATLPTGIYVTEVEFLSGRRVVRSCWLPPR